MPPRGRRRWRRRRVPKYWRYRLAPDPLKRRPKGSLTLWARGRRLLWSWWPWAIISIVNVAQQKWGWAAGMAALSLFG